MIEPLEVSYVQTNGDCALLIYVKPHPQRQQRLQALANYIRSQKVPDIIEVVPASENLMLVFRQPTDVDDDIMEAVHIACERSAKLNSSPQLHEIPVCYDPRLATDIEAVMAHTSLSLETIIKRHTATIHQVDFLGFLPGFAYLNGLHESLIIPRKSQPSPHTAPGSIAIANRQTGIYTLNSPAGWHVIGRTPLPLIDWQKQPPILYQPGDQIQFTAMEYQQFSNQHP
ncbi:MAG: allophanate hydrolase subunit 1 [Proteobacteria bacterium]|nr:MAG: allophanate hydrolase subunit 1 [Pseudomonadota bacterium]